MHQAGRLADAHINFQEAEAIQRKRGSKFKKLYSFPGFRYCDLLLTQGEYQLALSRSFQMVKWAERNMGLLTNALSQLAFGRAHLAMAVKLDGAKTVTRRIHLSHAENWLYQAMHKLRQAGHQDELTRGLLARAAWALAAQQFDQAHRDLTEARSIAERGEMRLYLCDYHLESARLHLAQGNKDKAREHWTTAREMVAQMGYHRRDKEVEEIAAQLG